MRGAIAALKGVETAVWLVVGVVAVVAGCVFGIVVPNADVGLGVGVLGFGISGQPSINVRKRRIIARERCRRR